MVHTIPEILILEVCAIVLQPGVFQLEPCVVELKGIGWKGVEKRPDGIISVRIVFKGLRIKVFFGIEIIEDELAMII